MTNPEYDLAYELDGDGEPGSLLSIDARGHLDFHDAEVFTADVVAEEFDSALTFGLDVEHLWRTTSYVEDGSYWEYDYSEQKVEGATPVTRFMCAWPGLTREVEAPHDEEHALVIAGVVQRTCPDCGEASFSATTRYSPSVRCHNERCRYTVPERFTRQSPLTGWSDRAPLMCINHPDDNASVGHPASTVIDADELAIDGHVYMCRECSSDFSARLEKTRRRMTAPLTITRFLEESAGHVEWEDTDLTLSEDVLRALCAEDAAATAAAQDFVARWKARHTGTCIAKAGYALLTVTDLNALTEAA